MNFQNSFSSSSIYLDAHATTPVDPLVLEAMLPFLKENFGNANSPHRYGWQAQANYDLFSESLLNLFGAPSGSQVVFTSGATESNYLALLGLKNLSQKFHVLSQPTEHSCVLGALDQLKKLGHEIEFIQVDHLGQIDLKDLQKKIKPTTAILSIMAANHEIGTIQPIKKIAQIAKQNQIFFHCDAAQYAGRYALNLSEIPIDLLTLSAHKIYGPKGSGALIVNKRAFQKLSGLFIGGGQQFGLRSGTLDLASISGLVKAFEIANERKEIDHQNLKKLRDYLWEGLSNHFNLVRNGPSDGLYHNLNVSFCDYKSDEILTKLKEVCVSSGSACSSTDGQKSHVIRAITDDPKRIDGVLRFGLTRYTTKEQIDRTLEILIKTIHKI